MRGSLRINAVSVAETGQLREAWRHQVPLIVSTLHAQNKGRGPQYIFIDEAAPLLEDEHTVNTCFEVGKELGRQGGALIWCFESYQRIKDGGFIDLIKQERPTQYLMGDLDYWDPDGPQTAALAETIGRDRARRIGNTGVRMQNRTDVIVCHAENDTLMHIGLDEHPMAAMILELDNFTIRGLMNDLRSEHGQEWLPHFLNWFSRSMMEHKR